MAVRSLNPMEQHAGKIFLGVVLIICLVLVLTYVAGDPVSVEKAGRTLSVEEARKSVDNNNASLAEMIRPGAALRDTPISPFDIDDHFPVDEPSQITLAGLSDWGVPVRGQGDGGAPAPQTLIEPKIALLTPMPQPKVTVDEKIINNVQMLYAAVASELPSESITNFRLNLAEQAREHNWRIPDDFAVLLYGLQIERQRVDADGQAIGPIESNLQTYFDPAMGRPVNHWEKEAPFPGPNAANLATWIEFMIGPPRPPRLLPFDGWLRQQQEPIRRPKLPDGSYPVVDGLPTRFDPTQGGAGAAVPGGFIPPGGFVPPGGFAPPGGVMPPEMGGPDGMPPVAAPVPPRDFVYAMDTSIQPATRYVYRIRYLLFNPLLCRFMMDDKHNFQVAFAGPWSGWSLPVQTEQDMYTFLTDSQPSFTVRRRHLGQWHQATFEAVPGRPIGQVRGGVDYRTGLMPVDIRRDVEVMLRSVDGPGRVTLTTARDVQVMVLDENGNLMLRSLQREAAEFEDIRRGRR